MELLTVAELQKSFGADLIFKDVSFRVAKGEHIGLVGANGSGKTTLVRCLLGLCEYDGGSVKFDAAASVGYVEQQADFSAATLYDEFLTAFADVISLKEKKRSMEKSITAASDTAELDAYGAVVDKFEQMGGYDFESRILKVAYGLGFGKEDLEKSPALFSGGWQTRILLAKALLREPDFLFLDEPTNHLDIKQTMWLETFLQSYGGGLVLISHDRFFLDRVAHKILELTNKTVNLYDGNYSRFVKLREEKNAALNAAYQKQQEYIKKTEEYIRRYRAGIKSKQARGRESRLNRLERLSPVEQDKAMACFNFMPPAESAERVAELSEISVSFGDKTIFAGVNCLIEKGTATALIGSNGAGKTTLLKVLVGELSPTHGNVKIGNRVKIGYFSQQHEGLHKENTLIDEIIYEFGANEEQARNLLGAFLFRGDEVFRQIGDLSGGEQSRLAFLKLMLTGANFLILDEPTNHLDIPAKEAVENALAAFPGTFLVVSHDRYFLDKIADRTLELENGKLTEYLGNYSYYRAKKDEEKRIAEEGAATPTAKKSGGQKQRAEQRGEPARRSTSFAGLTADKRAEMIDRAEAEIAMAEAELKGLEFEMNRPETQGDPEKSREIAALYAAKEKEIAERYSKWESLLE